MSLLEDLLSGPGPQERYMQLSSAGLFGQGASDPRASGMGSVGQTAFDPGTGAGTALAQRIAQWIEKKPGFEVGGLEGFQGQGPISSGHIEGSQHYTGHAGDVNYVGGGRFGGEGPAMDWLYNRMQQRWDDALTELIWRAPDHYDHLHYGTRPGG